MTDSVMPSRNALHVFLAILLVLLFAIILFLLIPPPVEVRAFAPGEPLPATQALAPNDALRDPQRTLLIGEGILHYPEDVTFDDQGRMLVGNRDMPNAGAGMQDVNERISRITFAASGEYIIEDWVALAGGGPLDVRFDAEDHLLVSSWGQGLIRIAPDGIVTTLVADGELVDGRPYGYSDGIAIASDGRIFHTQGTTREAEAHGAVVNFFTNAGPGRLIVTDPRTRISRTLIDDLSFGNGVALAPDESYVLVADQLRYRILRYWLVGASAGTYEVWMDSLPGMPHNLYRDDENVLLVALNRPRNPLGDIIRANPFLAAQLAKVPGLFSGQTGTGDAGDTTRRGVGSVLALDFERNVLLSLQNPPLALNTLSTAVLHDGAVYMGTIDGGPVLRYALDVRPLPLTAR